ncbi:MAG: hypothetical protein EA425_15830 [Puniceicoccaceae bacterium]|nr:MAG: hypothetical protein EA425_15830 [Puniceicoccaceae bacterium]
MSTALRGDGPIDCHVHCFGAGAGGSGCWIRVRGWRRLIMRPLLQQAGFRAGDLEGDFDARFLRRMEGMVADAGLRAAVLLAHDLPHSEKGEPMPSATPFHVPNRHVLAAARNSSRLLAGVSIHPARPDALDELEACAEAGAALIKLLPNCLNIDPRRKAYRGFWRRSAELGLPVLAHTGGEFLLPETDHRMSDPAVWEPVLEDCGLTVIAAHCGTRGHPLRPSYFPTFRRMAGRHERFYGDTSALHLPLRGFVLSACLEPEVERKLVHGSDFPVPFFRFGLPPRLWLRQGWGKLASNPLRRDLVCKQRLGFGADVFTRLARLIPARAWSGGEAKPPADRSEP